MKRNWTEEKIRAAYQDVMESHGRGESLVSILTRHDNIPSGTFYNWCDRLSLPLNLSGSRSKERRKAIAEKGKFVEFSPTGLNPNDIKIEHKGLTITVKSPAMLKVVVGALVNGGSPL